MYTFESMISELLKYDKDAINLYFSCYQKSVEKSIKIIEKKIEISDLIKLGEKYGWILEKQRFTTGNDIYYITRSDYTQGLGKHRLHSAGFFYMQEVAASLPAQYIDIKPDEIVLDMCSAPGGKAVQISDKGGYVVSNEVNGSRIVALQHNLNRIGVYNSTVTSIQGKLWGELLPNFFNHVLVDAPCSGEGTGFKSNDGTKWWREENIHKIAYVQKELLTSAIQACKVGGTIIYSTCTINPRENECVIAHAIELFGDSIELSMVNIENKSPGITTRENKNILSRINAEKVARFWPHIQHTGGFFIAKFIKRSEGRGQKGELRNSSSQLDISTGLQEKIVTLLLEEYGINIDRSKYFFISSPKQVYLTTPKYLEIHGKIFTEKSGVPIFKWDKKELIPLHSLGNCLGHTATKNTISLTEDQLQKYSEGHDIPVISGGNLMTNKNKYIILKYKEYGISVGKVVDGYIKNKFIK